MTDSARHEAAVPSPNDAFSAREASRRLAVLSLIVAALFAAADCALLPFSSIIVAGRNYVEFVKLCTVMVIALVAGSMVRSRFAADRSRPAEFIKKLASGLTLLGKAGLIFAPFAASAGLFMYLASNSSAPLIDRQLAAFDHAVGFDWMGFLVWVNDRALVARVLVFAYLATGSILALLFPFLSFTLREERLMELVALVAVTSVYTGIIMFLFPAAGAYPWYHPPAQLFDRLSGDAGMWHQEILQRLRSGQAFTYLQSEGTGLVTFPSFHTVLGVITTYSVRGVRVVYPVLIGINSLMIVATLPEGGHHLADIVAGLAVAVVGILVVRRWVRVSSDANQR